MPVRAEALALLYANPDSIIPLSKKDSVEAARNVEKARKAYDEARREFLKHHLGRFYGVAIFGSKELGPETEEYQFAVNLAKSLVETRDVDIVSGGGPGIMAAAHEGAQLAIQEASEQGRKLRAKTHGLRIDLPFEEPINGNINILTTHTDFSTRLQEFLDITQAAYNAPGGIGTLLEQMIVIQSIQVNHLRDYIVIAHPFWEPVVDSWNNELYHGRVSQGRPPLIRQQDLNIVQFSNSIPDIVNTISAGYDIWRGTIRDRVRIIP